MPPILDRTPALIDVVEASQPEPMEVTPAFQQLEASIADKARLAGEYVIDAEEARDRAAEQVGLAAGQVSLAAGQVQLAAAQVDLANAQRIATQNARAASEAARDGSEAARDQANSIAASQAPEYLLLADLPGAGASPATLAAYVTQDPTPSAFGTRTGRWTRATSTSPWVQQSADTVPGLAARVTVEQATREALIRTVPKAYAPGIGFVSDAHIDPLGRIVEALKDGVRFLATGAALLAQPYTVAKAYVPGIGFVDEATVNLTGQITEARKGNVWFAPSGAGLLPRSYTVAKAYVPGVGFIEVGEVDPLGRVVAASKGSVRFQSTITGLLAQPYTVAKAYVPGVGFIDSATIDPFGRAISAEVGRVSYTQSVRFGLIALGRKIGTEYDAFILGGTISGLMAAQRLSLQGLSVAIVEPTGQTGGVVSQGLTYTDYPMYGQAALVGGLTRQVFNRIADEYGRPRPMWLFEPKVWDRVFNRILLETGARVIENSPIHSSRDVSVRNGRIEGVRTREGWLSCGVAIDASYEMDLGRFAGAPWRMGRESTAEFGEPMAGFRTSWGYSRTGVVPNNAYPVQTRPAYAEGDADGLIQPYSFRTVLTNAPDRIPFPEPEGGYDSDLATMVVAMVNNHGSVNFADYVSLPIVSPPGAPYLKACINAPRLIGIELPGRQQGYPLGSWAQRYEIVAEHLRWELNLLYCLANDPRIPAALRASAQLWGFPADEWVDGKIRGFPDWPYVRESIRLRGAYTMTEFDMWLQSNPLNTSGGLRHSIKSDVIAWWAYFKDAHSMALFSEGANGLRATGNSNPAEHDVDPYCIPYRALYTDPALASHVSNLLVSLCSSWTSTAWMSGRMEPNFGMLGEAAGEAAAIMLTRGVSVENVPIPLLQSRLRALGSNI